MQIIRTAITTSYLAVLTVLGFCHYWVLCFIKVKLFFIMCTCILPGKAILLYCVG